MKKKELKALAQQIAKYEKVVQTSTNKNEVRDAQMKIMNLSESVDSLEDMMALDEIIQDMLEKS